MRKYKLNMKLFLLGLTVMVGTCTACASENGGGENSGAVSEKNDLSETSFADTDASLNDAEKEEESSVKGTVDSLKTTFIKCGKADIIILECGDETMVIDTGEDDDGDKITEYLAEQKIEKIDDLIITHYDKDHVGGAAFLLDSIPVSRIYVPDYEGTSDEYFAFMDVISEMENEESGESGLSASAAEVTRLSESVSFTLGDAAVMIDPPSSYEVPDDGNDYDNDLSLIVNVRHGVNTLLFMGDAEKTRIRDYMEKGLTDSCNLIKIPHHGRYDSALKELISFLHPEYAVITDSEKNPAEGKTLNMLEKNGVLVFRTSEGDVTAVSDGTSLSVTY